MWKTSPFTFEFVCTDLVLLITCIFCRYAQYGDVSPKIDVYAFGVVLYELISAKNAVLKTGESVAESKGLVALVGLDTPSLTKPYLLRKHTQFTDAHVYFKASQQNASTWTRNEVTLDLICIAVWRST